MVDIVHVKNSELVGAHLEVEVWWTMCSWLGSDESSCQSLWVYVQQFLCVEIRYVKTFGGVGPTPEILHLVGHHTKLAALATMDGSQRSQV